MNVSILSHPLVIMVGLTGAGKSTALENVQKLGVSLTLLPNRREITDDLMIAVLQREAGQPVAPVKDRLQRFEYTARYRQKYPGGMAHALSQLTLNPAQLKGHLVFDGLRGLNEVQYAAQNLPLARFIVLDAPNIVRLQRLLNRADPFDHASLQNDTPDRNLQQALAAIPHIEAIFSPAQQAQIAQAGLADPETLLNKVSIIVSEGQNYQPGPTRDYLAQNLPSERAFIVDTVANNSIVVAEKIKAWLDS